MQRERCCTSDLGKRLPVLSLTSSFFRTGHHGSWIIPQAKIRPPGFANGPGLIPDYLFASDNSDGVTWWVVDLKSPKDSLYKEDGDGRIVETDKLRNAINQMDEYDESSELCSYVRPGIETVFS